MAITYVGNTRHWANVTTSYVVSLTSLVSGTNSAPTISDVVIVNTGWTSTSNGAPTVTTAGYIGLVADQYANDTRDANAAFAYKIMGATPDTTVTVAAANNVTFGSAAVVYVYRGISTATAFLPLSLASVAINISNPRSRAITPEKSGQVVISGGFATADNSPVAKSGPSLWINVVNSLGSGATMSGIAMFAAYTSTVSGTAVQAPVWYGGETSTSDSAIGFVAALNPDVTPPTVALNTPADSATGQVLAPTLNFTGTDTESQAVEYEVQVDTANTFNSTSLASDNFNRADENPIGGNWTNNALGEGADNQLKIVSNQLQAVTAATSCEAYWNATTFSGSMETYFTVVTKPGATQRIALSWLQSPGSGAWDGYQAVWNDVSGAANDTLVIERVDNSAATTLASITLEYNTNDVIAFRRNANGIYEVLQNGTIVLSTAPDTTYTGNFYAAVTIRDTTGVVDNWGVRTPVIDAFSTTDAGFTSGHPFASAVAKDYTVQSSLTNNTVYYWRVRAIDPAGSNTWGAWSSTRSFTTRPKSAALTGTITASVGEADIVTGGKTLIITLTDDTWIAAGGASFDLQRDEIIAGVTSAQSELTGWNLVPKVLQSLGGVVRTSDTVVTITWDAFATYNITANETITVTVPSTALTGAGALVATPTFSISASGVVQTIEANGFMTTNTGYW